MPDTIRSEADLLTLFQDNSSGDISAQDCRDFIVSADVGKRTVAINVYNSDQSVAVVEGKVGIPIPAGLDGFNVTNVLAVVHTPHVEGGAVDVMLRRRRNGSDVEVLSEPVTIGTNEYYANDGEIDPAADDVATGDLLYVDVDAVPFGFSASGLSVAISLQRA